MTEYGDFSPIADKILNPDGSVTSILTGTTVEGASAAGAALYLTFSPKAAKYLLPDGSVVSAVPLQAIIAGTATAGYSVVSDGAGGLAYSDIIGLANALVYKDVIDCSTNPNYPAANAGWIYIVSVAGKIGGASGSVVVAGDFIVCKTDATAAGTEAAVGANWDILEKNIDLTNILITGGTINGATIGQTTPAPVYSSPSIQKGPAALTSFAGFVSTSGSSTTITFTSAADAILAGYHATNPILGFTLITTAVNQASVTRYIQSWTNSTTCVVDTACTLAASSTLASVQAPIAVFMNSAGVVGGYMLASRVVYYVDNVGIGTTTFGTSAAKVLGIGQDTAPTTSPADMSQLWSADTGGVAGNNSLHMRNEYGSTGPVGFAVPPERVKASTIALGLTNANGKLINNYGQADNCIYTLPACAANLAFDFIAGTTVAKYLRLTAAAGDALTLDGVKGADAGSIQFVSVAEGNAFSVRSYQTGAASWDWMVTTISGPLVVV